jgi:predicted nucleic-acid-binding Zn-ribbon protein
MELEELEGMEEIRICPKCGSEDLNIVYRIEGEKDYKNDVSVFLKDEPIWEISQTKQFYTLNRNILKIHCRMCQYEWWEVPHDER